MPTQDYFLRVYRVSTRNPTVSTEEFATLAYLPFPLPNGYCDYLMTFGRGELCSLRVLAPEQVLETSRNCNHLEYCPFYEFREWNCGNYPVAEEYLRQSVVFADTDQRTAYFCIPRYGNLLFHINQDFLLRPIPGGIYELVREFTECEDVRDFPYFHSMPYADERRRVKECAITDDVVSNIEAVLRSRWPSTRLELGQFFVREIEGVVRTMSARRVPSARAQGELEERKRPILERLRDAQGLEKLEPMKALLELIQTPIPECDFILQPATLTFDYDFELESEVHAFIAAVQR